MFTTASIALTGKGLLDITGFYLELWLIWFKDAITGDGSQEII